MLKTLAVATLSLGLATAALAQTSGAAGSGGSSNNEVTPNRDATTDPSTGAPVDSSMMPESWKGAIGDTFYSDSTAGTLRQQSDVSTRWSSLTPEQQAQVRDDCKTRGTTATGNMSQICTWVNGM